MILSQGSSTATGTSGAKNYVKVMGRFLGVMAKFLFVSPPLSSSLVASSDSLLKAVTRRHALTADRFGVLRAH